VAQFVEVILFRCGTNNKETRLFERNENIVTFTLYFIYPCLCFDRIVNKSYQFKRLPQSFDRSGVFNRPSAFPREERRAMSYTVWGLVMFLGCEL